MRGGKRLWARLLPLVASVTFGSFLLHLTFSAPAAHAADLTATNSQIQNATYTWVNMATVAVKIGNNAPIDFYDPNGVSHYTEAPQNNQANNPYRYLATTCDGNQSTLWANARYTSSSDQNNYHAQFSFATPNSDNGGCMTATINTGSISIGSAANASIMYTLSGKTITRADGDSGFTFVQNNSQYPDIYAKQNQENNSCFDRIVIENHSDSANNAAVYELTTGSGGNAPNNAAASGCVFSGDDADILTAGDDTDINTNAPGDGFYVHVGMNASTESSPSNGQSGGSSTPASSAPADCDAGPAVSWFICGVIVDPLRSGINDLAGFMTSVLQTAPLSATGQVYTIWQSFRDIADLLFVLAFMIAIFSTLVSTNVDAYTIKKVLPRLVAAAILVQFSFLIGQIAIDIGNILGIGVQGIFSGITGNGFNFGGGASQAIVVGAGLATAVIAGIALASISAIALITGVIAILAVIFTLILRQVLLLLLVVVAPVAFVAWILPGTEKFFKLWYTNLIKLVLMFPMIMALFGAGRLFETVAGSTGGVLTGVIQLVGFVVPLFLIPATFKASGSLMGFAAGAATGFAAKRSKQISDSGTAKRMAENRQRRTTLTATDPSKNVLQRAVARQRGGFGISPSTTGRLRMEAAAAAIRGKETEAAINAFQNDPSMRGDPPAPPGSPPGTSLTGDQKLAAVVSDPKRSEAEKTAAVQMLGRSAGGRKELTKLQRTVPGITDQRSWKEGIRANVSDIAVKAPHLLGGGDIAGTYGGGKMTGARVAGLDESGMVEYLGHAQATIAADPAGASGPAFLAVKAEFDQMSPRQQADVRSKFNDQNIGVPENALLTRLL